MAPFLPSCLSSSLTEFTSLCRPATQTVLLDWHFCQDGWWKIMWLSFYLPYVIFVTLATLFCNVLLSSVWCSVQFPSSSSLHPLPHHSEILSTPFGFFCLLNTSVYTDLLPTIIMFAPIWTYFSHPEYGGGMCRWNVTAHHRAWCQSSEEYRLISTHCRSIILCSVLESQLTE